MSIKFEFCGLRSIRFADKTPPNFNGFAAIAHAEFSNFEIITEKIMTDARHSAAMCPRPVCAYYFEQSFWPPFDQSKAMESSTQCLALFGIIFVFVFNSRFSRNVTEHGVRSRPSKSTENANTQWVFVRMQWARAATHKMPWKFCAINFRNTFGARFGPLRTPLQ